MPLYPNPWTEYFIKEYPEPEQLLYGTTVRKNVNLNQKPHEITIEAWNKSIKHTFIGCAHARLKASRTEEESMDQCWFLKKNINEEKIEGWLITWMEDQDDAANDEDARSLLIETEPLLGWKGISSKNPRKQNGGGFKPKRRFLLRLLPRSVFLYSYIGIQFFK